MKNFLVIGIILCSLPACVDFSARERGNGNMIDETFKVDGFSEIRISGAYEIKLIRSENERVEVTIDDNLLEYLVVDVRGSKLIIDNKERIYSRKGIEVAIFYREIDELEISGVANLETEGILESDELNLRMSGAGSLDMEVEIQELKMDIGGAGSVALSGSVGHQSIEMSGAGDYSGEKLISKSCRISISGVGNAEVFVEEELDASISGLGGVTYHGNPGNVVRDVSGLGAVRKAD